MDDARELVALPDAATQYLERCLNCDAALHGAFCAACGQRARPPRPTMRELAIEAWEQLVSLDGKVATTLRLLVTRPGLLTAEALAGRRARYVGAVRLYLLCSLLYFGATAIIAGVPAVQARARAHSAASAAVHGRSGSVESVDCRSTATGLQGVIDRRNCAEERDPTRAQRAMREAAPKAMFVLLPLFASFAAVAFRRRAYIEHLYFALHLHAFLFLVLLVGETTELTANSVDDAWRVWFVFASTFVYGVVAARRVYAHGWAGTGARFAAVFAMYFIVAVLVLFVTFVLATLSM